MERKVGNERCKCEKYDLHISFNIFSLELRDTREKVSIYIKGKKLKKEW